MISCPNVNLEEWKSLVNTVGEFEAYRDFFETEGLIRTPEEVQRKMEIRNATISSGFPMSSNPSFSEIESNSVDAKNPGPLSLESLKNGRALEFADKVSGSLGISYKLITPNEAKELTKNTSNPWSGQNAFFFGDQVFFIQDRINSDMVFHEFSHPFVRALKVENPALFKNIYNNLIKTEQGRVFLKEALNEYPLEDENSPIVQEEVIVKAMTKKASNELDSSPESEGFTKVIQDLFYGLKQLLRKLFGKKINLKNLSANTSLDELANIITSGEQVEINTQLISNEDIVAYNSDVYDKMVSEIENAQLDSTQVVINSFYDKAVNHLVKLKNNGNLRDLLDILRQSIDENEYQKIKNNLSKYQTTIENIADKTVNEMTESKERSLALSKSIVQLKSLTGLMFDYISDLKNMPDNQENTHKAYYFNQLIEEWDKFITDTETILTDSRNNVPADSEVLIALNVSSKNISKIKENISEIFSNGARDAIYEQLLPAGKQLQDKYEARIERLKDGNPKKLDSVYKEYYGLNKADYNRYLELKKASNSRTLTGNEQKEFLKLKVDSLKGAQITKDKIELLLKTDLRDANYISSILEGYLYNTDPIVGGLALYTKNALNEVMIVNQEMQNDYARELGPLIKKFSNFNEAALGRLLGFEDNVTRYDRETGELEDTKIWSFLNPWKNYRRDEAHHLHKVQQTNEQYNLTNNDEDYKAWLLAKNEYEKWKAQWMTRDFVDSFYEKDKELIKGDDDLVGIEAKAWRDKFFDDLNAIQNSKENQLDELEIAQELDEMWRTYKQKFSRYDLNGDLKEEDEALIAERLRNYRDKSRKFYEFKLNDKLFKRKYFNFLEELKSKGIEKGSPEYDAAMDDWKKMNTRKAIKPEYFEKRNNIIEKISTLLGKLNKDEKAKVDQTAIWTKIFEVEAGYRDEDNQIIGSELSEGQLAMLYDLQKELKDIKEEEIKPSGLNGKQSAELKAIYAKLKNLKGTGKKLSAEDDKRFKELKAIKDAKGLSEYEIAQLRGYYKELGALSERQATDYYIDIVNNHLSKSNTDKLQSTFDSRNIDVSTADRLLDTSFIDSILEDNPEFKKWWNDNHIVTSYYDTQQGQEVEKYERLHAWNNIIPADPNMVDSYEIKDGAGNVIDVLDGVPSMKFYSRNVKPQYKTQVEVGVNKDNQGNWLPKNVPGSIYRNEEYYNLKDSNPEAFELLEGMKKFSLERQKGSSKKSKLYYDFPRFKRSGLETAQTTSLGKAAKDKVDLLTTLVQRGKDFIKGDAEDKGTILNYDDQTNMMMFDNFDSNMKSVPVFGLFDIDHEDASTNIATNMMRYLASLNQQNKLIEKSPIVRAIQATVKNKDFAKKEFGDLLSKEVKNRSLLRFFDKDKDQTVREKAVDNLISRDFEGESQKGLGSDVPWLQNVSGLLMKRASFSFFAMNLTSALKNSLGMQFQGMIEASAGEALDMKSFTKGNMWATKAMGDLSFRNQLYTKAPKSHIQQLVEIWDPTQGKFEENIGEQFSRTILKDAANLSWLYSPRKWVELQATMSIFAGMMHKKKIKRLMPDGTVKEISYIDAFETVDGQITLKSGIDVRYGTKSIFHKVKSEDTIESIAKEYNMSPELLKEAIKGKSLNKIMREAEIIENDRQAELEKLAEDRETLKDIEDITERNNLEARFNSREAAINSKFDNKLETEGRIKIDNSEFKFMKNKNHQVINDMGGAYAKFDQPEMQRYWAFRLFAFLRRYFTTMATKRWGHSGPFWDPQPRFNPGTGDTQMGFYMQFLKNILNMFRYGPSEVFSMNKEEKGAYLRMTTELGGLYLLSSLFPLLFGWDPDDEERYEKLRAKSGALPFPFVGEDKDRPDFDLFGYMELHALHMSMQVHGENKQFNLVTGGLDQYNSLLDLQAIVKGPTTDSYLKIGSAIGSSMTGDPKAYYTRDVGAYVWQKEGASKWKNYLAKTLGLTGKDMDPAAAIQSFQAWQAIVKR